MTSMTQISGTANEVNATQWWRTCGFTGLGAAKLFCLPRWACVAIVVVSAALITCTVVVIIIVRRWGAMAEANLRLLSDPTLGNGVPDGVAETTTPYNRRKAWSHRRTGSVSRAVAGRKNEVSAVSESRRPLLVAGCDQVPKASPDCHREDDLSYPILCDPYRDTAVDSNVHQHAAVPTSDGAYYTGTDTKSQVPCSKSRHSHGDTRCGSSKLPVAASTPVPSPQCTTATQGNECIDGEQARGAEVTFLMDELTTGDMSPNCHSTLGNRSRVRVEPLSIYCGSRSSSVDSTTAASFEGPLKGNGKETPLTANDDLTPLAASTTVPFARSCMMLGPLSPRHVVSTRSV